MSRTLPAIFGAIALLAATQAMSACEHAPCSTVFDDAAEPQVLATDPDHPYVAWRTHDADVRLLRCDNALCTSGTSVSVWKDPAGVYGDGLDMIAGIEGMPLLAFRDSAKRIRTVQCGTLTCSPGGNTTGLHSSGLAIDASISLSAPASAPAYPLLAYITGGFVNVAQCQSANCATSTTTNVYEQTAMGIPIYASRVSITHRFGDRPYLAWLPKDQPVIGIALCGSANCSGGLPSHAINVNASEIALSTSQYDRAVIAFRRKDGSIGSTACTESDCSAHGAIAEIAKPALGSGEVDFARGDTQIPMLVWAGDGLGAMRCSDRECARPNLAAVVLDPGAILSTQPSLTVPRDGLPLLVVQRNGLGFPSIVVHKCASPSCL